MNLPSIPSIPSFASTPYRPLFAGSLATLLVAAPAALLLPACATADGDPGPPGALAERVGTDASGLLATSELPGDGSDEVFRPDRLLHIDIDIDEPDWDHIRTQERAIMKLFVGDCLAQPFYDPYTYRPATITVDGVTVTDVGLRKKGFLGSVSRTKPALKVDFDEYVDGQRYMGMKRMTLNNVRQDPSYINTCLGYQLFAQAGVPASRCNFAVVTVNGQELGLYAHVESVKKPFLARHFNDAEGNLYEGTLSDFREEWQGTFERKTNKGDEDRSDIDALVDLLAQPDDVFYDTVDDLIALDEFMTFWAMEVLLGHEDGYAGNLNNFYIYHHPADGKWHFLPWGIDDLFDDDEQDLSGSGSPSSGWSSATAVEASGILARRLYDDETTRDQYVARIVELLDTVWDEDAILAEIDRMEALISPHLQPGEQAEFDSNIARARLFVDIRRESLLDVLLSDPPDLDGSLRSPLCLDEIGSTNIDFTTTWQSLDNEDPFDAGSGTFDLTLYDEWVSVGDIGALAGPGPKAGRAVVAPVAELNDDTFLMAHIELDIERVQPGEVIEIDWGQTDGKLVEIEDDEDDTDTIGWLGNGTLSFAQAGSDPDDPIAATIQAIVYDPLWSTRTVPAPDVDRVPSTRAAAPAAGSTRRSPPPSPSPSRSP